MTDQEYLSTALAQMHTGQWYSWKKENENGDKIPNDQRMTYANIIVIKDGITKPTEAEVEAKIQEIKDAEINAENKKVSGKQKLKDLGLDDDEIKALVGV